MKNTNSPVQSIHRISLLKIVSSGAAIALILIAIFLFQVKEPDPDWGKYWFLRPLIIVTLAGATGGAFYYFMDHLRNQGGWKKVVANISSLLVYIFGLWAGTILGLAGTLWD